MNCKHNYARVNEPRVLIQIFSMINRGRTAARKVNLHKYIYTIYRVFRIFFMDPLGGILIYYLHKLNEVFLHIFPSIGFTLPYSKNHKM